MNEEMEREFKNFYFRMLEDMNELKKKLQKAATEQEKEADKPENAYVLGLINGQISAMDIFDKFLVEELQNVNYDT